MSTPTPLLDVAEDLIGDPAAKAAFAEDPDGFLAERGLDGLTGDDLSTALEHVADALPAATAARLPSFEPGSEPLEVLGELAAVEPPTDSEALDFGAGAAEDLDQEPEAAEDEPEVTAQLDEPEPADDAPDTHPDDEFGAGADSAEAPAEDAAEDDLDID
jgi:hypothetical protein